MIIMENVKVPEDSMFKEVSGLKGPFGRLNNGRYGISWGALGAADFCLSQAQTYALERWVPYSG